MNATTGTNADTIAWLVRVLGGEATSAVTRPLTDDEFRLLEERLARFDGDPVAALGEDVDDDTAAYIRALPVGIRR
jgi:hypothetical protein